MRLWTREVSGRSQHVSQINRQGTERHFEQVGGALDAPVSEGIRGRAQHDGERSASISPVASCSALPSFPPRGRPFRHQGRLPVAGVLDKLHISGWLVGALRALYLGSTARMFFAGVVAGSVFDIAQGMKQGCPSSGSVWALVFDPSVRLLRTRMPGPRDELSVLALLCVFDVAAGLALNYAKSLVINYRCQSYFTLKRRLLSAIGGAQLGVARSGVYLGTPIGPAERTYSGMLLFQSSLTGVLCYAVPRLLSDSALRRTVPRRGCAHALGAVVRGPRRGLPGRGCYTFSADVATNACSFYPCIGSPLFRRGPHPVRLHPDGRARICFARGAQAPALGRRQGGVGGCQLGGGAVRDQHGGLGGSLPPYLRASCALPGDVALAGIAGGARLPEAGDCRSSARLRPSVVVTWPTPRSWMERSAWRYDG